MNILVTGAYGQLGSELKELSETTDEFNFIFTDEDTLDITNEKLVELCFRNNKPSVLINCAAYTAVDKAEENVSAAHLLNTIAPGILARACKINNALFIHISTDYVFDGFSFKPYSEFDSVNPSGVYGKTKLAGEQLIRSVNPNTLIIRTAWLYSSYGNNFVKTMIRLGKEREVIQVVYDQVGTPTYAADLANAILEIVKCYNYSPEKVAAGIYNYSNEGVASWYDFAKNIFEISGVNCQTEPVETKDYPTLAKRPQYSVLNKSKIKTTFNMSIPYWRDSLKICIDKIQK